MPTWTVSADRRSADYRVLTDELRLLGESIAGLTVHIVDEQAFDGRDDAGNFRDFAPVARLHHGDLEALRLVAEDLITEFGWLIDLEKTSEAPG